MYHCALTPLSTQSPKLLRISLVIAPSHQREGKRPFLNDITCSSIVRRGGFDQNVIGSRTTGENAIFDEQKWVIKLAGDWGTWKSGLVHTARARCVFTT